MSINNISELERVRQVLSLTHELLRHAPVGSTQCELAREILALEYTRLNQLVDVESTEVSSRTPLSDLSL